MQILGLVIGFSLLIFMLYFSFNLTYAAWCPINAKPNWVQVVNFFNGKFLTLFRWTGPLLLLKFSVLLVFNFYMLVVYGSEFFAS